MDEIGLRIPSPDVQSSYNRAILHNPEVFDKPFEFIPERYLRDGKIDPSVPDTDIAAFGSGRR